MWHLVEGAPYSGKYMISKDYRDIIILELSTYPSASRVTETCSLCDTVLTALRDDFESPSNKSTFGIPDSLRFHLVVHSRRYDRDLITYNYLPKIITYTGGVSHDLINFEPIRQLINDCNKTHGGLCRPNGVTENIIDISKTIMDADARFVDVCTDQVISASSGVEYIALSYVWGGVSISTDVIITVKHGVENSGDRYTTKSYAHLQRKRLPCTELLGERYLWVGALCVDPDKDCVERKLMIHAMDKIYRGAILTIVAANGTDANAGLPGLNPGERNPPIDFKFLDSCCIGNGASDINILLSKAKWSSRAWTYQEHELSTARLFSFHIQYTLNVASGLRRKTSK